ncbi:hypothetical protein MW887_007067 [Aspergillus wentii]|nr:hypothetical protein MW887_007067 [Aspergillus wentii]
MLTADWVRACRVHWVILVFTLLGDTAGETDDGRPACQARGWREVEAEYIRYPICAETRWEGGEKAIRQDGEPTPTEEEVTVTVSMSMESATSSSTAVDRSDEKPDHELDTDSPLDNANFLSFEDWKKQNLAKAGQSAENVGGHRRADAAHQENRRRPTGINNALDALGDDTEIELDFGGFGADTPEAAKPTSWGSRVYADNNVDDAHQRDGEGGTADSAVQGVPLAGASRRRDAGTTCKERFNYASFDCAATVLKTNSEGKGSSSVLIENKDSYMLNECRAKNKFLILELCDDILVDTVVLANYEFFSSIFHTFRVSVSDRYPAKLDQWKELGVYEARNTREVQAFAVENPLIWARYLKIEFLTHYGNEFFCPLSLIRVHGTTMMEEYKHDGEVGRVEDEIATEDLEPATVAVDSVTNRDLDTPGPVEVATPPADEPKTKSEAQPATCLAHGPDIEALLLKGPFGAMDTCSLYIGPAEAAGFEEFSDPASTNSATNDVTASSADHSVPVSPGSEVHVRETAGVQKPSSGPAGVSSSTFSSTSVPETGQQNETAETEIKSTIVAKEENNPAPELIRPSATQPPSSNPTTQESFFKSVNKRLQMLESNSTLSLLYIEEQSRILRDAFSKVEKRQLAKTSTFLENLNVTVLNELKQFREQYDQVWRAVAFEFEHQRMQYHHEVFSLSAQLGVLADELVFQKRVAVIQSIMVLFCFGLILFSRGAVSSYMEFPRVQNMVSRSYSFRSSSPGFGSPSVSPSSTRPTSSYRGGNGHRRNLSDDSQGDAPPSPTVEYSPPTPVSDTSIQPEQTGNHETSDSLQIPSPEPSHVRSRSSPPVLNGCDGDVDADGSSQSGLSNNSDLHLSIPT